MAERAQGLRPRADSVRVLPVTFNGTRGATGRNMTRSILTAAIDSDWRLVSQERPCPVCGGKDSCGIHTVDKFACCARAPSEWKLTNGSWLHRLAQPASVADVPGLLQPAANVNGLRA